MYIKTILLGFLAFWCFLGQGNAQEVDYGSLKVGDTLPNGLLVNVLFDVENSDYKMLWLSKSLDFRALIETSILLDGDMHLEFEGVTSVQKFKDCTLVTDVLGNIFLFNEELILIKKINVYERLPLTHELYEPLSARFTDSNLILFQIQRHLIIINSQGEEILIAENAFSEGVFIDVGPVYEKNENELILDMDNMHANDQRIMYHIDLKNQTISQGPNIYKLAKENNFHSAYNLHYSTLTDCIYVNVHGTFFVTDWDQSFFIISKMGRIYDFIYKNPIHIKNSNRILLVIDDEIGVFDIKRENIVEFISFDDFFSEFDKKVIRIESVIEKEGSLTLLVQTKRTGSEIERAILKSDKRLSADNYKKLEISEVSQFTTHEEFRLNH